MLAAPGHDLGLGRRLAGLQLDEGARRLAPFLVGPCDDGGGLDRRVLVERVLDLDRGDVLAAGDDDILGAVLELDVAVRMAHAEIAGVEPAAGEGGLRGLRVLEVALHHDIAAHHDLAERGAVARDGLHRFGIEHVEPFERRVAHALPRLQHGLLGGGQGVPVAVPVVDHGGAVALGEPVEMRHLEAGLLHAGEHGLGRRGGGGEEGHRLREVAALLGGRVEQGRHHDRRAAEMGDAMVGERVVHRLRAHLSQADMGAGDERDRPGEAPAVAVEHRQRPEIDRMAAHLPGEDVRGRQQIGAAVVIDHALGVAGRAGGVVQRDRIPLVGGHDPGEIRIAARDERLVFDAAKPLAGPVIDGVVIVDDERLRLAQRQRLPDRLRELPVRDQDLGLAMVERKRDDRRVEAGIERVEHGAAHRHAVMAFEHGRGVGQHGGDGVVLADAVAGERRGEPARAGVEVSIAAAQRAVNDRDMVRIDARGTLEEGQRRERLVVGRVAVEIGVVGGCGHAVSPPVRLSLCGPSP